MSMTGRFIALNNEQADQIVSGLADAYSEEGEFTEDIDKAWHAIHYMLTEDLADGEAPYGYVIPLVTELLIEGIESDYGVFLLDAEKAEIAYDCIKDMTEAEFREKYDFDEMAEAGVYPIMEDEDKDEFLDYVCLHFKSLKEFYKLAVEKELNVIFYIS